MTNSGRNEQYVKECGSEQRMKEENEQQEEKDVADLG
jgi:hypothetical protein